MTVWSSVDDTVDWDIQDVDRYDALLLNALSTTADSVLGMYDVLSCKKTPDVVANKLMNSPTSTLAAIRLYKRKRRRDSSKLAIQSKSLDSTPMDECVKKYITLLSSSLPPPSPPSLPEPDPLLPHLLAMISIANLTKLLKVYPKDKSCGMDGIHILLILALSGTTFYFRLSHLFGLCIQSGTVPSRWNHSLMFLLPKTKTPPITCDHVRPLSILPIFRRLFDSLILPAFTNPSLHYCKLHPSQAGFRIGYSTLTQAAICHHAIESKSIQFIIFLDFQAAYDVILSSEIMAALQSRNMPARLCSLVLSSMFNDASYNIVVNSDLSNSISRNRGLPQGSPLSPIIFNLFINSLVVELNQHNVSDIPHGLFYADDGALLAPDLATAKILLRIAERWARDHGMTYNISKCGVLCIQPGLAVQLTLNDKPIPVVDTYTYLGFPMTSNGINFLQYITNIAESTQSYLKLLEFEGQEWSPSIRWAIYCTFVRPQMEYGAPLIMAYVQKRSDVSLLDILQKQQNRALNWVLCSSPNSPHNTTHEGILGTLPVMERFTHLRCRFQFHLDQCFYENPLRRILHNHIATLGTLLGSFHRDLLYNKFKCSPEYNAAQFHTKESDSVLLTQYLLSLRADHLRHRETHRVLLRCISPGSRTQRLVDKVFYAPTLFQRDFVIWRRGILFWGCKCTCGAAWNRGHIHCLGYIGLPDKLDRAFQDEKPRRPKNFNVIDFLLNEGQWELAHNILHSWKEKLLSSMRYISILKLLIA